MAIGKGGKGGRRGGADGGHAGGGASPMEGFKRKDEWAGLADLRDLREERRRTRRYTFGWRLAIVLGILLGLFAAVALVKNSNDFYSTELAVARQVKLMNEDKPGKQAALESVYRWVDGRKGAYPGGVDGYSWDGAKQVGSSTDGDTGVVTTFWSHTISFIDLSDSSSRTVAQLVQYRDGVATALGQPTVLPSRAGRATSNDRSSAPDGYRTVSQGESLTNAVEAWGKAYVGKDPNALTVLVGDPDGDHAFMPARLGTYRSSTINWAVAAKPGDGKSDGGGSAYGAVSVNISFVPYGAASDSSQSVSTNILLLVRDPGKGSARVVDWGADMGIKGLKPYSNAVDKSAVSNDSDSDSAGTGAGGADGAQDGQDKQNDQNNQDNQNDQEAQQ